MQFSDVYTKARSVQELGAARKLVAKINEAEEWAQSLSDAKLTEEFQRLRNEPLKNRARQGFALVREAARRVLGLRHFDVQLIGGLVLLGGKLAEMRTGEGKTLTITAPAAVLALEGKGVHVVTANSYLARRDAELMRPVYEKLGLTVGAVFAEQPLVEKTAAYQCDVTYGVGSEFGFDYLKDHLAVEPGRRVQRGLFAAIVDEVDSILIDEARVPLIISDTAADMADVVTVLDACVKGLQPEVHFTVDMKEHQAQLTDAGYDVVERALVAAGQFDSLGAIYEVQNLHWARRLHSAVRAYALYRKDRDYVVSGGELVLVDAGTGRKMEGRRLEDGLHEALEAREGLTINRGTVTKATITYQNFFGLYEKLGGLTGTAMTEAEEFTDIYGLETVEVPTNRPVARKHLEDLVFLHKAEKFEAAVAEAARRAAKGQPVLLGCGSIRDADVLDRLLTKAGVAHETLTARHVDREAHIIAGAGRPGAVTVATNMAGRGTDILLGGEKPQRKDFETDESFDAALRQWDSAREAVVAAGGLFVLGTERNGIRRVDNQLAGRSGRQGDPGEVQFFLSLEDELLQVFGRSKQLALVRKMIAASGSAMGGKAIGRLITTAQQGVENQGFSARKSLMQFDKVLSDQRLAVYALRDALLDGDSSQEHLKLSIVAALRDWAAKHFPAGSLPEEWPLGDLKRSLITEFGLNVPLLGWANEDDATAESLTRKLVTSVEAQLATTLPDEATARSMVLEVLSEAWTDHLAALDELRTNVSLKDKTGFNPIFQFGKDAFELFKAFERHTNYALASLVLNKAARDARDAKLAEKQAERQGHQTVAIEAEKRWISRNEACPCGSGLKFKQCHGRLA